MSLCVCVRARARASLLCLLSWSLRCLFIRLLREHLASSTAALKSAGCFPSSLLFSLASRPSHYHFVRLCNRNAKFFSISLSPVFFSAPGEEEGGLSFLCSFAFLLSPLRSRPHSLSCCLCIPASSLNTAQSWNYLYGPSPPRLALPSSTACWPSPTLASLCSVSTFSPVAAAYSPICSEHEVHG